MTTKSRAAASEHRVKGSACPACGKIMDAATNLVDSGAPRQGDLSICLYCQALLQFEADGRLKMLPAEVLADIARRQPKTYVFLRKAQQLAAEVMKRKV